jgi:DNA mismatch repair protein MutL
VPSIDFDTVGKPDIPVFDPHDESPHAPTLAVQPSYNPFKAPSAPAPRRTDSDWSKLYEAAFAEKPLPAEAPLFEDAQPATSLLQEKSPAHYQYKGCYIMTAVKSGLMIIDQYRASVRIRFERYLAQRQDHSAVPQRVLFPEAVQFPPAEAALLQQMMAGLVTMGFELSDLGGGSFAVNAIPSGVEGDPVTLIRNIVADAIEHDGRVQDVQAEALALTLARQTAVPHGQVLSNEEMETLVNQLFSCSNVNYTPDGKTILAIMPQHDIEQLLG